MLPIELAVKSLNLLLESHIDQQKLDIKTYKSIEAECQEFKVPAMSESFQIQLSFKCSSLGKFTIIGKLIKKKAQFINFLFFYFDLKVMM